MNMDSRRENSLRRYISMMWEDACGTLIVPEAIYIELPFQIVEFDRLVGRLSKGNLVDKNYACSKWLRYDWFETMR